MVIQQALFEKIKKPKVKKEKYLIGGQASFNGTNIITIQITHNGKRAGKIVARNGGMHWFSKGKTYGKRLSWTQFAKLLGES